MLQDLFNTMRNLHQIILADKSLSDSQTGIGVGAHATLNTEQPISHIITAPDDTVAYLQEWLFQFQKCMNYLRRFMTFGKKVPCQNGLVIQFIF